MPTTQDGEIPPPLAIDISVLSPLHIVDEVRHECSVDRYKVKSGAYAVGGRSELKRRKFKLVQGVVVRRYDLVAGLEDIC